MAHFVVCLYCQKRFDTEQEPFVKPNKVRYAHKSCADLREASKTMKCPVTLFGTDPSCDYYAENIHIKDGKNCFTLVCPDGKEEITIQQLGTHNVLNGLVAVAVAGYFGIKRFDRKNGKKVQGKQRNL